MILIGIDSGTVVMCVSVNPDQVQLAREMYPDWVLQEQTGDENIGWTTTDNKTFSPPQE